MLQDVDSHPIPVDDHDNHHLIPVDDHSNHHPIPVVDHYNHHPIPVDDHSNHQPIPVDDHDNQLEINQHSNRLVADIEQRIKISTAKELNVIKERELLANERLEYEKLQQLAKSDDFKRKTELENLLEQLNEKQSIFESLHKQQTASLERERRAFSESCIAETERIKSDKSRVNEQQIAVERTLSNLQEQIKRVGEERTRIDNRSREVSSVAVVMHDLDLEREAVRIQNDVNNVLHIKLTKQQAELEDLLANVDSEIALKKMEISDEWRKIEIERTKIEGEREDKIRKTEKDIQKMKQKFGEHCISEDERINAENIKLTKQKAAIEIELADLRSEIQRMITERQALEKASKKSQTPKTLVDQLDTRFINMALTGRDDYKISYCNYLNDELEKKYNCHNSDMRKQLYAYGASICCITS